MKTHGVKKRGNSQDHSRIDFQEKTLKSLKSNLTRVLYRVWSMHAKTRRQTDYVKRRMTLGISNCHFSLMHCSRIDGWLEVLVVAWSVGQGDPTHVCHCFMGFMSVNNDGHGKRLKFMLLRMFWFGASTLLYGMVDVLGYHVNAIVWTLSVDWCEVPVPSMPFASRWRSCFLNE